MRIVVVLPLPLGPRKPQIFPRDLQVNLVDYCATSIDLLESCDVDG